MTLSPPVRHVWLCIAMITSHTLGRDGSRLQSMQGRYVCVCEREGWVEEEELNSTPKHSNTKHIPQKCKFQQIKIDCVSRKTVKFRVVFSLLVMCRHESLPCSLPLKNLRVYITNPLIYMRHCFWGLCSFVPAPLGQSVTELLYFVLHSIPCMYSQALLVEC